jgi:hypothetical protein
MFARVMNALDEVEVVDEPVVEEPVVDPPELVDDELELPLGVSPTLALTAVTVPAFGAVMVQLANVVLAELNVVSAVLTAVLAWLVGDSAEVNAVRAELIWLWSFSLVFARDCLRFVTLDWSCVSCFSALL